MIVMRRSLTLVLGLLCSCSSEPPPEVVLECGDSRDTAAVAIVNELPAWTSSVVALTPEQARAVGALLQRTRGGEWENICTATLIGPQLVLTGAHCVVDARTGAPLAAGDFRFTVGEDIADPAETFAVAALTADPEYDPDGLTAAHDLAVLELSEAATAASTPITPLACNTTPLSSLDFLGASVQNVGYGCTDDRCSQVNTQQWWIVEEVVSVVTTEFAIEHDGWGGVCYGDSGGPALWTAPDGAIRVMGTLSWGTGECGASRDWFVDLEGEQAFLGQFVPGCGSVDNRGYCDGETATYCDNGTLREEDCTALGRVCGPDASGNARCLDPCQGETLVGRCDGDHVIWCEHQEIKVRRCADCEQRCAYVPSLAAYYCE